MVYFIRDDDVGELTDALRAFAETFLARAIPVSYQIIPVRLTQPCADYLAGLERDHPGLIEFGQHGLTHQMQLHGRTLLREFGPERTLVEQRKDIERGRDMLTARLARQRPIQVFTPPQHKYDANTVRAAAAAGHKVFSAAYYPGAPYQLAYALGRRLGLSSLGCNGLSRHGQARPEADIAEVSISLDVDDGEVLKRPAARLDQDLERARRRTDKVGLMFHHAIYADRPGELHAIADQLALLGAERFRPLGSLAA